MLYGIAGAVSLALTLLSWWVYVGPFRWFGDLQQTLWGVNILNLTLAVTWALLYLPLHFVARGIEKRSGVQSEPVTWRRLVSFFEFLSEQRPGQLVSVGIIFAVMGLWLGTSSATSGPLTTLDVAAAERGETPRSRYVRLEGGTVLTESELTFTRNGNVERYFPVVAHPDESHPVRVFVRLGSKDLGAGTSELVGQLEYDGLPGALRADLQDRKLLAPDYFVVRAGTDPEKQATFAFGMALFGVAFSTAGLLWAWRRRRALGK